MSDSAKTDSRPVSSGSAISKVRGTAPSAPRSVRGLAAYANVHQCRTAAVAFAAGIDSSKILSKTGYEPPFGQSPFAIARGNSFERLLRKDGYASLLATLSEGLGTDFSSAQVIDLRHGYPPTTEGRRQRAEKTRELLLDIIQSGRNRVVLDGAVFRADVGGESAFFEADEVAIGVNGGILIGENKSWPVIDRRPADPDALGAALDQAAMYVLLARSVVANAGLDPHRISGDVLIITPRNTGLAPTLNRESIENRIYRLERLLAATPKAFEILASIPSTLSFGTVGDTSRPLSDRIAALEAIMQHAGTSYDAGTCMSSCVFATVCRLRLFEQGSPRIAGRSTAQATQDIPGGLPRIAELAAGAHPEGSESRIAATIQRAAALYNDVFRKSSRRRTGGV